MSAQSAERLRQAMLIASGAESPSDFAALIAKRDELLALA
jgi:hypothetical protein